MTLQRDADTGAAVAPTDGQHHAPQDAPPAATSWADEVADDSTDLSAEDVEFARWLVARHRAVYDYLADR